jgi:uridine kinase
MKGAEHIKPVIIGVTGGTASGKTSLCMRIAERIGLDCAYIALDSFYRGLTEEEHHNANNYNFDHPKAIDFDTAYEVLLKLRDGVDCEIPQYDFTLH